MKKILLLQFSILLFLFAASQTSEYSGMAGKDPKFTEKYTVTVTMNTANHTIKVVTTAPLKKVIFSTYTKEQLAVRKGTDYTKNSPGTAFTYNLNTTGYKNKHAYWLKFYTTDGLFEEYYFQKKTIPVTTEPVEETTTTGDGNEIKNAAGATVIKTNINCAAGKSKVIAVLKTLEGVFDVTIDSKTGKLIINYSSDGTPYTDILKTINENGFIANGQKPTTSVINPCGPKTD